MKYLSRLYCVLLLLAMAAPHVRAYDYRDAAGIYYNISGTVATVTHGAGYGSYSGDVAIPATVTVGGRELAVTAVGESAFRGSEALASVTVGENVTTIGDYAFLGCTALETVTMDNDEALTVGVGAFMNCSALTQVRWRSCETLMGLGGLYSLATNAFAGCKTLNKITIPGNLAFIGSAVFDGCDALAAVTLESDVPLKVKSDPLSLNTSATTLLVPIGTAASYKAAVGWRDYDIRELDYTFRDSDGYRYRKTGAATVELLGCDDLGSAVTVRSRLWDYNDVRYDVTAIATRAFAGTGIRELDTRAAFFLKSIGDEAFEGCTALQSVTLVEGLTTLGESVFAGCKALKAVQVPSTVRVVSARAFENCTALALVRLVMGVGTLCDRAFAGCTTLKSILLPRSVMSVEATTFAGCTSMESYEVDPASVYYASVEGVLVQLNFGEEYDDTLLGEMGTVVAYPPQKTATEFYVPCGVHTIGENAFAGASHLRHLALPATVSVMGDNCLAGTSLQSLNLRGATPMEVESNALSPLNRSSLQLQVPVGAAAGYRGSDSWRGFANITERYDVFNDDRYAYDWDENWDICLVDIKPAAVTAGTVTLPQTIELSGAAYNIAGLASDATAQIASSTQTLRIPSPLFAYILTTGGRNPLNALENLQQLTISDESVYFKIDTDGVLTNYRGNRLYYYPRYRTAAAYSLPAAVDTVMPRAFAFNSHLAEVNLTQNTKTLGAGAFMGCDALAAVNNAVAVTVIGDNAFGQCARLLAFNGGEKINTIGARAFAGCASLDFFPFYHGMLRELGAEAFAGCTALKVAVLSNILTTVGDNAFEGCTALERVYFTSSIAAFGQELFKGCTALRQLWLCNTEPPAVTPTFLERCGLASGTLMVPQEAVGDYRNAPTWSRIPAVNASYAIDNGADVNNDKVVNALDVTILYSAILGIDTPDFAGHLDVNRDGAINAADVTFVYSYILEGQEVSLTYKFVNERKTTFTQQFSVDAEHQWVYAVDGQTEEFVPTGLSVDTDRPAVLALSPGTRNGIQCCEIVPLGTGYCTLVARLTAGGVAYYRAYPLRITP